MSFASYISRIFGKKPVWLYRIEVNETVYHYTSRAAGYTTPNDSPTTDFPTGQVWSAVSIIRGEIYQTTLANRNDTWVRLATRNAAISQILNNSDFDQIKLDIWQGFVGDPDDEFVQHFSGRLVEVEADLILTTLTFETSITESSRSSVAQVVQRPCRHAHYFTNADGGGCGLTLADHQLSAEATVIDGRAITVPMAALQPDGTYLAGILEYDSKEYMIQSHVGEVLTIENEPPGLADAVALGETFVLIAPGCDLTIENCNEFDNVLNFGGFETMRDSEFDGRSIA